MIVRIQESRTYVKKKQSDACNFVNKPKFQRTVLCVLMMNESCIQAILHFWQICAVFDEKICHAKEITVKMRKKMP